MCWTESLQRMKSILSSIVSVCCRTDTAAGTQTVHRVFVERLVAVLGSRDRHALLVHISIPGNGADDRTPFSRSKREAERAIVAGAVPYVILRPGFVIARSAYGGSALMRALALLPMELPRREADQAFMTTDVADIARTVDFAGRRWRDGERRWNEVWEVMARQSSTVGQVIEAFRQHLGGPKRRLRLPSWLMDIAAAAGDLVAHFGWSSAAPNDCVAGDAARSDRRPRALDRSDGHRACVAA